jgi:membrane-bound lytic murein transglycosylase B
MGYGQFMPSSYRAYAKDFDGDDFIDIWQNPTDAIGSVANYFVRHGWLPNEPVTDRVRINDSFNADLLEDGLKPKRSVSDILAAGYSPLSDHADDEMARVFKLDGANGDEYWMGLQNFYVITRYNRSTMYAMAVHQLSQEIKQKHERGQ